MVTVMLEVYIDEKTEWVGGGGGGVILYCFIKEGVFKTELKSVQYKV